MAQYEHTSIYRKSFELAVYINQIVPRFSKLHKYSLGTRLIDASQSIICRVIRAQNTDAQTRVFELQELRIEAEVMKNLLHLARELSAFKSINAYQHAAELAVEIAKQNEGWLKNTLSRMPESQPSNPQGGRP